MKKIIEYLYFILNIQKSFYILQSISQKKKTQKLKISQNFTNEFYFQSYNLSYGTWNSLLVHMDSPTSATAQLGKIQKGPQANNPWSI